MCTEDAHQFNCLFQTLNHPCACYVCFQMQPQLLPKALTVQWLISASGSYSRSARSLAADVQNSDLDDIEMCRIINDRIMTVRPLQLCVHLLE